MGDVKYDEILGTLVRTKPKEVSQGGVFSGYAVFDSVMLEPQEGDHFANEEWLKYPEESWQEKHNTPLTATIICLIGIAIYYLAEYYCAAVATTLTCLLVGCVWFCSLDVGEELDDE